MEQNRIESIQTKKMETENLEISNLKPTQFQKRVANTVAAARDIASELAEAFVAVGALDEILKSGA